MRERLDVLLVERGYAPSREKAKALIQNGQAYVDGQQARKAGAMCDRDAAAIEIRGEALRYVGRGGLKLEAALEAWPIFLAGKVCVDVGASTGGFTDCMLQHGAAKVYAVDVGHGQLAERLREDSRVLCMEGVNFRSVTREEIPETPDFISVDVSFISLEKILPTAWELLRPGGQMVCLVKPQFEAGRGKVGKRGVVKDGNVRREVLARIVDFAGQAGFRVLHLEDSPIRGQEGNIEYLLHLEKIETPG